MTEWEQATDPRSELTLRMRNQHAELGFELTPTQLVDIVHRIVAKGRASAMEQGCDLSHYTDAEVYAMIQAEVQQQRKEERRSP